MIDVVVHGKQVETGAALSKRIKDELPVAIYKYFDRDGEALVVVSKDGHEFSVDISIHLDSGIRLQSEGKDDDAHKAFEDAQTKMEKRVRRYKRKLCNHRNAKPSHLEARYTILDSSGDEDESDPVDTGAEGGDEPVIIAEQESHVPTLSTSMAVMQLGLTDAPALLFRNAATDRMNMVYERPDGQIGWVDPK